MRARGLAPRRSAVRGGADDHGGGPVAEHRGVACRHGAPFAEGRLQLGQRLRGRVRPHSLVARDGLRLGPAADGDRHRLGAKAPLFPGRGGALVALGGKAVLVGSGYAALAGNVFGGLAHVPVLEGAPQAVVDHGVDDLLVAVLPAGPGAEQQIGRLAHAFHAAGDDQVGVAGPDGLGRQHDRLEARAAHLVDREGGDGVGSPALRAACRAGFWPTPACSTLPMMTSSTRDAGHVRASQGFGDRDRTRAGAPARRPGRPGICRSASEPQTR